MNDNTLIKLYGNIIRYKCPCCGEINEYHESTIEMMKENGKTYIVCDGCDNKINIMTHE